MGDAHRVVIHMRWDAMDWGDAADRHCARYGRLARLVKLAPHRVTYDCVDPKPPPAG